MIDKSKFSHHSKNLRTLDNLPAFSLKALIQYLFITFTLIVTPVLAESTLNPNEPEVSIEDNSEADSKKEQQEESKKKENTSSQSLEDNHLQPIAIYLSWENIPSRSMTIRWITKKIAPPSPKQEEKGHPPISNELKNESPEIKYGLLLADNLFDSEDTPEEMTWKRYEAHSLPFPENNPYIVHAVSLQNLLPASEYSFRIEGTEVQHTFLTAPEKLTSPVTFVIGDDCNQTDTYFKETTSEACKAHPLFTVIGGDLAYATPSKKSKPEDCDRWIKWLVTWYQEMQVKNDPSKPSRLVPLLVAIGNHEVKGRYGQSAESASFFYTLFRYPYLTKGYYTLRFGDYLSLYILDSGHTAPVSGDQKSWLQDEMKKDSLMYHKIASYHVPAYPSVRYYRNNLSSQIRRHWIPIFDKERLHLAFEHHDHSYKRTFPLKDNKLHPRGVVYIGDGSWGAKERLPKKANRTTYLATTAKVRQFCKVVLSYEKRDVIALSSQGSQVDQYSEEVDFILAQKNRVEEKEVKEKE